MPQSQGKEAPVKELPVTVTAAKVTVSQPLKPVSRSEKRTQTLEGRVENPIHVPPYATNVTRAITSEAAPKIGREDEKISGSQHKNVWEKEQVDLECERMRQELARKEKELELFMIEREKIRRLRNTFAACRSAHKNLSIHIKPDFDNKNIEEVLMKEDKTKKGSQSEPLNTRAKTSVMLS
ncbi:uncharacterized protein LOC111872017 [Cryptotermes secundus]|uniref:uncharacterized protein LOC111872017 n=1 Tax=Cryptotermes secundus TaxID=105785 RepID=UPI001454DC3C|nr:uncharacterized protein LOC111872017 [Cryptotermes secundus]